MHNQTLTICIATYNRAAFLDELLDDLIVQIANTDSVSILVVDGCSTDNTQDICLKYSKISTAFKSILLEEKGGIDKDFDIAVRSSNSDFCWLFCDDDKMRPGAVKAILDKINSENPDLMIINASVCNYELDTVLLEKSIDINEDVIIQNQPDMQDKIFELCQTYLGVTDALLVRKSLWCNVNTELFYGNRFGDMCTVGKFPQLSKVIVIHEPHVLIRLANAEWTDISFKIWYSFYPDTINIHSQLSDRVKKILVPDSLIWHIKFLLSYRTMNAFGLSHYREFLKPRPYSIRAIGILILLIPPFALRYFFILKAFLSRDVLAMYNLTDGRVSRNSWKSDDNTI